MARVFLRLKLALLGNGFRRGWQQAVGIVVGAIYSLPLSMLGARGLAELGRREPASPFAEPLLVAGFAAVWVGWVIGPLIAFGMDETLDPGRLRLLPLRRRQLVTGLLAASAVGVGPLATAILLYGVIVGFAPGDLGALIVIAAAIAQFLLCITTARAVTTALSRRLSSRRGRDLATVMAALIGLVVAGMMQLPRLYVGGDGPGSLAQLQATLSSIADTLNVLPPAWAARAVAAAAAGDLVEAALWLAAVLAAVAAALWWWATGLERAFDAPAVEGVVRADADLFPRLASWLPRTRFGAGVAKDLRYSWRVPQLRVQYLILGLMVIPTALFATSSASEPAVVALAPLGLLLIGATGMNLFGADRGAVWLLDTTGPRPRNDLAAKAAVPAILGLPVIGLVAVALAAATGGWSVLPPTMLIALGVAATVGGVGMVISVLAPFPLPDSPTNVFAANAGAGCSTVVFQGVGLLVELVLLVPVAILALISVLGGSLSLYVPGLVAVVIGAGVWWVGLGIGARRMVQRGPEFVAAMQPRTG